MSAPVSQGAREAAVAIRVALYRAEPSMPSYDKDVVEPVLAAFETTARKNALEEAAKVAEGWCGTKQAAGVANTMFASICIATIIRALGSQNDG